MLIKNLRQVLLASLPIILIVLFVHFVFVPFEGIVPFIVGYFMLLVGESVFLLGIEGSIVPMGEHVASGGTMERKKKGNFSMILVFGFVFGICASIAEPDLHVLFSDPSIFGTSLTKFVLLLIVGLGVGIFATIGLLRSARKISTIAIFLVSYLAIFSIAIFVPTRLSTVAFDAGSASTGVVTAPFLIALCSSLSAGKPSKSAEESFGLIGIVSIGPTLVLMLLFLMTGSSASGSIPHQASSGSLALETLMNVGFALLPVLILFFIFESIFIKLPLKKKTKILTWSIVSAAGLFMMLFGLEYGFVAVGKELGTFFGNRNLAWLVIILGGGFGFLVTFAEPAVRVLAKQVQEVTNGNIKSNFVIMSIGISMIFGISISVLCVILSFNIFWLIAAFFLIALVLMFFSTNIFVAIAFDSGGVALGPISTAFLFPLIVGLSSSLGGVQTLGILAMIGIVPILVMEILGTIYAIKTKTIFSPHGRKRRAYLGFDKYSNMTTLQKELQKKYGGK